MIYRGPTPDIAIPTAPLHSFILEHARRRADRTALIDAATGTSLTFGELDAAVRSAAAGLAARGLRKGDVVAIDAPNSADWVVAFLGVVMAGGTITTISPLFTPGELGRQLADSRARLLITIPALLGKAQAAAALSAIQEILVIGGTSAGPATSASRVPAHTTTTEEVRPNGPTPVASFSDLLIDVDPPDVSFDVASDTVVLPFSSGTTGMPKGVMLTHRNLVANIAQTLAVEQTRDDDVVLGVLPFFHIYGMVCIMGMALRAGATIVTQPRFQIETFLESLQKYGLTHVNLVPPIILALAKHPAVDRYDLSRLRSITSGAAPLGSDVQAACAARIDCCVRQGYGLTETSPVTHLTPHPPSPQKAGSVGPPLPNTEVMIVDPNGKPRPPGTDGMVMVRGPQVMKGYFDNPDATAATITADGWLRTGDIGRVDSDGYLYIVDRAKELIKYKAHSVAPAELEAVLLSHPSIADAAVTGRPDEHAGEVPHAFVVRSGPVSEEEIMDFVADRVAAYKKIRGVSFRDSIPKSSSGKILRRELRSGA